MKSILFLHCGLFSPSHVSSLRLSWVGLDMWLAAARSRCRRAGIKWCLWVIEWSENITWDPLRPTEAVCCVCLSFHVLRAFTKTTDRMWRHIYSSATGNPLWGTMFVSEGRIYLAVMLAKISPKSFKYIDKFFGYTVLPFSPRKIKTTLDISGSSRFTPILGVWFPILLVVACQGVLRQDNKAP